MKKELAILIAGIFAVSSLVVLADSEGKGFNEFGVNSHARVYHGWLDGAEDYIWNTVKWSKDWTWDSWNDPDPDVTDVGAWVISNLEQYYGELGWMTWDGSEAPEGAELKFVLTFKVMKVSDNPTDWALYKAAGAEPIYGYYYDHGDPGFQDWDTDVPKFVKFQQHLKIYEWTEIDIDIYDWVLVYDEDFIGMPPYGVGQPLF